MPPKIKVNFNLNGLQNLENQAKQLNRYVAKVGILGDKNFRSDSKQSNAEIGATHEFGSFSKNIPRRSFLRDPFFLFKREFGEKIRAIILKNSGKNGEIPNAKKIFDLIGAHGVALVQKSFATGGFGKWKPLKQSTIDQKGSSAILIDTAQLRKSITFKTDTKSKQ